MLWRRKPDPVIQAILGDLAKVGCNADSLEAVAELENPPSIISHVLHKWDGKVPSQYTQLLNRVESAVYAKNKPVMPDHSVDELIRIYQTSEPNLNSFFTGLWDVASEIYLKFSDHCFDDVAALLQDRRYGVDRQMLALALGKSKRPEAVDVLLSVLDDYGVSGHATEALAKLRSERARGGLVSMLGDDRQWVRTQARKGLARLDEAAASG